MPGSVRRALTEFMENEFEILAAKVLAGEASPDEQSRMRELLSQSAELRDEFTGLKAAWKALSEAGPMAAAMHAPPAPIPEDRLNQLQEVVREKLPVASASSGMGSESTRAFSPGEPSAALLFWQWLRGGAGRASVLLPLGSLLVLAAGALLLLSRPAERRLSAGVDHTPIAYLFANRGSPEVWRNGAATAASAAAVVRTGDEIHLPSGTEATLVTSNGIVALRGPQRLFGRTLATQIGTPLATNIASDALRTALFSPARQLLATIPLVTTRGGETIPLYSPMGATATLTPLILWRTEPGKTYDLIITDEFDANASPWRLDGIVPPLDFAQIEAWKGRALKRQGLYRLRLSEAGKPLTACEYTFRTLNSGDQSPSGSPTEKLLNAVKILASDPSRVGDALAELLTLPPELGGSELALRLKLLAFGQLGYHADFDEVTSRLQAVP